MCAHVEINIHIKGDNAGLRHELIEARLGGGGGGGTGQLRQGMLS